MFYNFTGNIIITFITNTHQSFMQFHLGFNPKSSTTKITHADPLLFIGSCFSEHIANHLLDLKFSVNTNPFGIIFNPKSIELILLRILDKNYFTEKDIFEKEGVWLSVEAHSSFSSIDPPSLLSQLNNSVDLWNKQFQTATFLTITFGSAFYYKHKETGNAVANCHKLPQHQFDKLLLDTSEITTSYQELIRKLKQFNPSLTILFTVSPVKHLKDGVVENSLSKSILIQAAHRIVNLHQEFCIYFPAFELVNDDLRDYRFYEPDMAHPNRQAIDYVWQKFSESFFDINTKALNETLRTLKAAMNHRILNTKSPSTLAFMRKNYDVCLALQKEMVSLDFKPELHYFSSIS